MAAVSYLLSLIIFIYLPGARTSENLTAELISLGTEHGGRLLALTTAIVIGCVLSFVPAVAVLVLAKITDRFFKTGVGLAKRSSTLVA